VDEDFDNWNKNDPSWTNGRIMEIPGYGNILGRFHKIDETENISTGKVFDVSKTADQISITFQLFEFDGWGGEEDAKVIINGNTLSLGNFVHNNLNEKDEADDLYSSTVRNSNSNSNEAMMALHRTSNGAPVEISGHSKLKDEIHSVTITVPKWVYQDTNGTIEFMLHFTFNKNKNRESVGIGKFHITEHRGCSSN